MESVIGFGGGLLQVVFGTILPYLIMLTILIFVHEFGHFIVGRWCGVRVDVFAIGFGRELFGFNDRKGTRWKFCAIPLGGYVKFAGDANGASAPDGNKLMAMTAQERSESLFFKPVWQRASIVAAGPIANFLLAIVLFAGIFYVRGVPVLEPVLGNIRAGSAAEAAGLLPGDRVLRIDGDEVESFEDLVAAVSISADRPMTFLVQRGGGERTLTVTPKLLIEQTNFGVHRRGAIGAESTRDATHFHVRSLGPGEALVFGVKKSWFVIDRTVRYFGGLIAGRETADQISGPIGIAAVTGEIAKDGFIPLLYLGAVISVSLGFFNLLPIPILDGGHLLFYLLEAIRSKPLSLRVQEFGFRVGLSLLGLLILFATYNDIRNFIFRRLLGV